MGRVGLTPVVEPRPDVGLEVHLAPDAAHDASQAVVVGDHARLLERHEVHHLGDALRRQEPRHEDGGVREVHLLGHAVVDGVEGEVATLPLVEQRGEDARRIEAGAAEPVDGAVGGDERRCLQVADQAVIRDGWVVRHPGGLPSCSRWPNCGRPQGSRHHPHGMTTPSPDCHRIGAGLWHQTQARRQPCRSRARSPSSPAGIAGSARRSLSRSPPRAQHRHRLRRPRAGHRGAREAGRRARRQGDRRRGRRQQGRRPAAADRPRGEGVRPARRHGQQRRRRDPHLGARHHRGRSTRRCWRST